MHGYTNTKEALANELQDAVENSEAEIRSKSSPDCSFAILHFFASKMLSLVLISRAFSIADQFSIPAIFS